MFETADADLADEWMTAAYGTGIRMSGLARGTVLRAHPTMLGDVVQTASGMVTVRSGRP